MIKLSKKQIIKGSVVIGLYLLFLIWAKSLLGLIVLPILVDIYFIKKIPWGFWKKMKPSLVRTLFSWLDAIVFALIAVTLVNIFIFQNYQIPTSSLEKSLLVGDHLYVSKLSFGPRIPNTPLAVPFAHNTIFDPQTKSYSETPHWDYKRVKGLGSVKRNDIVVFNYPSGDTVADLASNMDFYKLAYEVGYTVNKNIPDLDNLNKIDQLKYFSKIYSIGKKTIESNPSNFGNIISRPVDRRDNYVKRCLALPGDTLQIIDSKVFINGVINQNAKDVQYNYFIQTTGPSIPQKVFKELGINLDDSRATIRRDIYVENRMMNNKTIFSKQGVSTEELSSLVEKYGNSQQYNVLITNHKLSTFLEEQGFDPIGFTGKEKIIYQIPLTLEMVNKLNQNKALISHIVQEPDGKLMIDSDYNHLLIYPLNGNTHWDKNNYGPIWMPKQGSTIEISLDNYAIYERCIRTYEGNTLEIKDGEIYINGKSETNYTFKMDYYWMMGDNRDNSLDSRYWGFVPMDHIVGKPLFVWLSLEKDNDWFNGKIRWNRFFKWVR